MVYIRKNDISEAWNDSNRIKMNNGVLEYGNLKIDVLKYKVTIDNKPICLTLKEYKILLYLASQPDRVFTYQQIYEVVWDEPYAYEKNNIMTHISHLRGKIEPDPSHPRYIENVRGVGYRFKKQ